MQRLGCLAALLLAGCGALAGSAEDLATSTADDGGVGGIGDGDAATAAPEDLAGADLLPPPPPFVYVSGYSTQIGRYQLDPTTGALTSLGTSAATGSPSFLAVDPARRHLYAVDEANSKVEAFTIDAQSGALTHVGTDQGSGGSGPAHLSVDQSGKWVLVANYGDGAVAVLPIGSDGSVGAAVTTNKDCTQKAHQVLTDATNQFAFVECLQDNVVRQYHFDASHGTLTQNSPATAPNSLGATNAITAPRHLALRGSAFAYVIEETDSMIDAFSLDTAGHLTLLQRQTTRAPAATIANTGAEVQVHPSGKFVYGSNRGDDDIAVFTVASDGKLTPTSHTKTGGQTPRHFSLDPTGKWLLVANQTSGDIRVFSIDSAGSLKSVGPPITATMPSFVGVVPR